MSKRVIFLGERVSLLAPRLPRVVTIRPAFESFERDFLTNVGSALTLSASIHEEVYSPGRKPRAAMMCAATVNWTLVADIESPAAYVMFKGTIKIQVFCNAGKCHVVCKDTIAVPQRVPTECVQAFIPPSPVRFAPGRYEDSGPAHT